MSGVVWSCLGPREGTRRPTPTPADRPGGSHLAQPLAGSAASCQPVAHLPFATCHLPDDTPPPPDSPVARTALHKCCDFSTRRHPKCTCVVNVSWFSHVPAPLVWCVCCMSLGLCMVQGKSGGATASCRPYECAVLAKCHYLLGT